MKFYAVFLVFLSGCNLLTENEHPRPASNNGVQTNNQTQTNNGTTVQSNNGTATNNATSSNNNTTSHSNNSTGTSGVFEIPFESIISESRSTRGLVGQWKFDDADPTMIADTSRNNPPMNLTGNWNHKS